ncbi:MAG: D-alanine--D-alanine ligase [Bacteroidota bacterium]|nr:D-alanine--D-alanine ligase [Bacteroidota bacterium]
MKSAKGVLIYHSPLESGASADELDVLKEASFVARGLRALGYNVVKKAFPINLEQLGEELQEINPLFVYNLVETIRNDGRLISVAPLLFEHFRVPYTGCNSDAIYLTSNKLVAKRVMISAGIPTPLYCIPGDHAIPELLSGSGFLIKSIWEHASFGMDEHLMKIWDGRQLRGYFKSLKKGERDCFAEQYIDGREFNVSIISGQDGPVVLPLAEIEFRNYPATRLKIVGYRAKWDEQSFEYKNTCRVFREIETDRAILSKIREISMQCWETFGLSGYARVDFRIDHDNKPWVLEVNTNPCISPDSGFMAAARQADMDIKEVIERIIYDID